MKYIFSIYCSFLRILLLLAPHWLVYLGHIVYFLQNVFSAHKQKYNYGRMALTYA